jgi:hypothetical protein
MTRPIALGFALAILIMTPAVSHAARADRNCYEEIGCPWKQIATLAQYRKQSCENLAHVRNHTFYENHYCFHTNAAKAAYGNKDCKYPVAQMVPFNSFERANLALIKKVEKEKRCK